MGVSLETCFRLREDVPMRHCFYALLRRLHDVPIRCREDVLLRRLGDVPSRRTQRRRYDVAVLLPGGFITRRYKYARNPFKTLGFTYSPCGLFTKNK